jgi:hypothetical protein
VAVAVAIAVRSAGEILRRMDAPRVTKAAGTGPRHLSEGGRRQIRR